MKTDFRRIPKDKRSVCSAYLHARDYIIEHGYEEEVYSYQTRSIDQVSSEDFLRECAWVVLASGFKEQTLTELFPQLSACYFSWKYPVQILENESRCINSALQIFNHRRKLQALVTITRHVYGYGVARLIHDAKQDIGSLRKLPYIGPVTQYHLAKNLGLPVAKPDRHLLRIVSLFDYSCVQQLCKDLETEIGDPIPVIDSVFWRYSTLVNDYMDNLTGR